MRQRQNGRHVADYIFKSIFLNENVSIIRIMDIYNSNYGYPWLGIMDIHKRYSIMDIYNSIHN